MQTNSFKKLAYIPTFLSAFLLASTLPSYSLEIVKAKEIVSNAYVKSSTQLASKSNAGQRRTFLGDPAYSITPDANRPEFHIKSIGEILSERRARKAQKAEMAQAASDKKEDIQIFCREMEYFDETGDLEARDNVEIYTADGTKAVADRALYNKEANTIKLFSNVVLTKRTSTIEGDYMFIDLNEENALMDEPKTTLGNVIVNAKEGYAFPNRIETLNGDIQFKDRIEMELATNGFLLYNRAIPDTRFVDFSLKKERSKPYSFKTKEVVITPEHDYDSIMLKSVDILYKDKKIASAPYLEIFQDKNQERTEIDFPYEIGSVKGFGTYAGLGHTFKLPKTKTLRLTPAYTFADGKSGIGIMGQFKSKKANLQAGWSSSTNDAIVDGRFRLFDKLNFDVARHAYRSEGINGGNRPGYLAEFVYEDTFGAKDLFDTVFKHRISAGYVADYRRSHQEDHMHDGFRYTYQAELFKIFKSYQAKEQDTHIDFGFVGQTMVNLYSQGDTLAFARFGPIISSRVKRWVSNITYTMGGVHGKSPYYFDEYRYGRQTINFDESIIVNRLVSLGYRGTLTLLKDNREKDLLTENRFYIVAGPEDFKIAFSYDTIRQNMKVDFLFLLGTDNMNLKYDKMTIKDPNQFGKKQKKQSDKDLNRVRVPEDL